MAEYDYTICSEHINKKNGIQLDIHKRIDLGRMMGEWQHRHYYIRPKGV